MGAPPSFTLTAGQVALIHTGGMLPAGADAVVMLEHAQQAPAGEVEIARAVASGENRIEVGEDIVERQEVIARGVRLGPAERPERFALRVPLGNTISIGSTPRTIASSSAW